MLNNHLK